MKPIQIIVCFLLSAMSMSLNAQEVEIISGNLGAPANAQNQLDANYSIELERGQSYSIDLSSEAFDAILMLSSPSGAVQLQNDDYLDTNSRIEGVAVESGTWTIQPGSYSGETGQFELRLERGAVSSRADTISGVMDTDSIKYGRYAVQDFALSQGESIYINVDASTENLANPPILTGFLHNPNGEILEFGDYNSSLDVLQQIDVSGTWRLYIVNEDYELSMQEVPFELDYFVYESDSDRPDYTSISGALSPSENQLPSGEYFDRHEITVDTFEGTLVIELSAAEFDTYLVAATASDRRFHNDDSDDPILSSFSNSFGSDSKIEISSSQLEESDFGTWNIVVTSYSQRKSGDYEVRYFIE